MQTRRLLVIGLILFLGTIGVVAGPTFPPFENEVNDDFGHIRWRSAVEQSQEVPDNWVFRHDVWNLDADRNCRIEWDPIGLKSLIPPGKNAFSKSSLPSRPREHDGTLYRAGGVATGQSEERTKVYLPEGHEALVSSSARFYVDSEGGAKPITVSGDSVMLEQGKVGSVQYKLMVDGLNSIEMQGELEVSWQETAIDPWPGSFIVGPLRSDGVSSSTITLGAGEHPTLSYKSTVKVVNLNGEVVAEASMPSLVRNKG